MSKQRKGRPRLEGSKGISKHYTFRADKEIADLLDSIPSNKRSDFIREAIRSHATHKALEFMAKKPKTQKKLKEVVKPTELIPLTPKKRKAKKDVSLTKQRKAQKSYNTFLETLDRVELIKESIVRNMTIGKTKGKHESTIRNNMINWVSELDLGKQAKFLKKVGLL